ncbi:DUF4825 domain-containing protein [Terrabacter sp. NPDC000476]|uniref:DUF4825 domain-containing protein n=1 Tax=Terrabacter sp. NPDC000476 TaxID=3154258 RepID=UPI003321FB32
MARRRTPRRQLPPRLVRVVALGVVATALGACSGTDGTASDGPRPVAATPSSAGELVETLWVDRSEHVGDNSRVVALVADVGLAAPGRPTLELQTSTRPYGVTIRYADGVHADPAELTRPATLLLGTIGNLGRVRVEADGTTFTFSAADATRALGYDVKRLGQDRGALEAYLREAR